MYEYGDYVCLSYILCIYIVYTNKLINGYLLFISNVHISMF